ncbi:MAG: DUF3857 domain-containing protein [Myxococcota bacterium]
MLRALPLVVAVAVLGCATPPHTPPVAEPAVEPKTAPIAETSDEETPTVAVDLTEIRFRVEEDGTSTLSWRDVYRLRSAEPGSGWSHVFAWWQPWRDDAPTVDAVVVSPDGTTRKLDPKTVSDQANKNDDGMLTDEKLRIAPLPNLTLGSVVERSSSVRRRPLFVKGASVTLHLAAAAPEKKRVVIIDAPASVKLHLESFDTDLVPTRTERDGRVELRYERGPASPPKHGEPAEPPGRTPDPVIRVSTVESWQAAATAWTEKAAPQLDVAAVKELATGLVAGKTTREQKVAALTAWLRGAVRYTGLELDEAAWVPRRSSEVLERKYGDCKDLSVLLTAMLRAVGIDADPALVLSGWERDVTPGTPGLTQFNHAIVRVGSGPELWVDPTAPWTALGELPPGVLGRRALVARRDTTGLSTIGATAVSTLDTRLEWFFSPSGPVRTVRTRTSDGWLFRDGREVAARSTEEYRKNLETYAKERQDAKGTIRVDVSEPAAAGPFREVLEIPDSHWGRTDPESAAAFFAHDMAFAAIGYLLKFEAEELDEREAPIHFVAGSKARVTNVFHPPIGYRLKELPEGVKETVGPLTVSLEWKRGAGDELEGTLDVDFKGGAFSVDEARRFIKDVYPRLDLQVRFPSVVFTAIKDSRYHAAVKEAEALVAKNPTPVWRSLLAYALSAAGLQSDAEAEARRALAEAPKDLLVRNRLAFVLVHNEHGLEFGRGFKRAELLKLLEESIALEPENEWTRRMHALVLMRDDNGRFTGDPKVLAQLEQELGEYREKTKNQELDDELIDVWLRQKAWSKLAAELPKFPRTEQRDGAWLAAELVLKGADTAFRRAAQEDRLTEGSSGLATQYVMLAREYDALAQLFAFLEKMQSQEQRTEARNDEMMGLLRRLKKQPPPPAGTTQAAWLTLTAKLLDDTPSSQLRELVSGELSDEAARALRRTMGGLLGRLPRGAADVAGFAHDFITAAARFESKPLPGFGELVTMRVALRGVTAPTTLLMKKGPTGAWLVRFDVGPELAAKAIELHVQGKEAEALEHLRALVLLTPDAPRPLKEERADFAQLGFAWAAETAIERPNPAPIIHWLEKELAREDLAEFPFDLSLGALTSAWKEQPEKRLALGRQLEKSAQTHRRDAALLLQVSALQDLGRHKEALALLDKALVKAPRDRLLREFKSDLLPKLGEFEKSRAINRELAAEVEPQRAAGYLNDAAWWSLFSTVDDAAVQEIERSLQINATSGSVNTAACVYATAGKYDSAAQEMLRMARSWDTEREHTLHPSYWYARGLVAEGFGRLDTARALYKRVTKEEKSSSPADVWNLAQKRLTQLGKR